jgi:hypothetical protein
MCMCTCACACACARVHVHVHAHVLLEEETLNTQSPSVLTSRRPDSACPAHAHPAPHTLTGARKGVLETVAAVKTRRRHVSYLVTGPGSRHGLGAQSGIRLLRIPAMASSQGDVRSSPMAFGIPYKAYCTQRCGRCHNSRFLHGQTRALPLSSTTCSARTSPSTILRHR